MPERYGKRLGRGPGLARAHERGDLVKVRCMHCNITRHYLPAELRQLAGDATCDEIRARMRCERCRLKEYLDVDFVLPTAAERVRIRLRRLVEVRMVRKIVWRDE
jgi:hypothetical protein